ncbi:EAL domain-containing protein [Catellatospora sp. KI3]|uniref:sensor domain-containing phosphodiesterase n=1 Tax=Catellatospora sp. KI3 TaxID=3041620 RepID=UPI0024824E13|nr:EAL domain-containing protein [Catellatospora sp. KI3]MDI1463473.1 EAL domain-containing protein [Catellatospora sp. KI3]
MWHVHQAPRRQPQASDRARDPSLDDIIGRRLLRPVFQPIVAISDGRVAGYEALIRGPADSVLHSPAQLFEAARPAGRTAELDWIARSATFQHALDARLPEHLPLFVNVEPASLRAACPPDLIAVNERAYRELQVVVEITERQLDHDPAALVASITRLRERSARIALDDVGANPSTLATLPLIAPEVIKLDRGIVHSRGSRLASRVVNAVLAESERTGAVILAEGIETDRDLTVAASMGATLGQGWFFGYPGALPHHHPPAGPELPRMPTGDLAARTPFEHARRFRTARSTTKELLIPLSRHIESQGLSSESSVLLSTFQHHRYFLPTARRYRNLATRAFVVAVFGTDMPGEPCPGVRGSALRADDPLVAEWNVIVIGTYFACALFACDRRAPSTSENSREFDVIVSYDRDLIIDAARTLVSRLPAVTG